MLRPQMKHVYLVASVCAVLSLTSCSRSESTEAVNEFLGKPTLHTGCCDASAGVAVSSNLFLVANDEDNLLRVYRRDISGPPLQSFEAGTFLAVDAKKPETDLEGAARVGDTIYWISSHGRNRSAEERESRHRFFATRVRVSEQGRVTLETIGKPYTRLQDDMLADPRLARLGLAAAALKAPKDEGGFNIEGLCATSDGRLLIGFRNPIPQARAIVLPLENPAEVVQGSKPRFGEPMLLDLGGRGVRDIAAVGQGYIIIGGPPGGKGKFHLYQWNGTSDAPQKIADTKLKGANPEALVVYPGVPAEEFQILSDDGTFQVKGEECKTLKDISQRRFRSFWVRWSPANIGSNAVSSTR
jgi:hypothetical protein